MEQWAHLHRAQRQGQNPWLEDTGTGSPPVISVQEVREGLNHGAHRKFGQVTEYDIKVFEAPRSGDSSAILTFTEQCDAAAYFDVCFEQVTLDRVRRGWTSDYQWKWRAEFLDASEQARRR